MRSLILVPCVNALNLTCLLCSQMYPRWAFLTGLNRALEITKLSNKYNLFLFVENNSYSQNITAAAGNVKNFSLSLLSAIIYRELEVQHPGVHIQTS